MKFVFSQGLWRIQADWSVIATGMGPEKHTAYAVQWFAMALALRSLSVPRLA